MKMWHDRWVGILAICILMEPALSACSRSSFAGDADQKKKNSSANAANGNIAEQTGAPGGVMTGDVNGVAGGSNPGTGGLAQNAGSPANLDGQGRLINCPAQSQNVLVLDFKSGWWAGDGGDFVNRIIGSGLASPCQATVKLEYHHLILSQSSLFGGGIFGGGMLGGGSVENTQLIAPMSPQLVHGSGDFATAFGDPSWASYNEIWLLSGSAADPQDLPLNHPFFQQVLAQLQSSKAGMFIGVGFGSISHAVAAAQALGLPVTFTTTWPEGSILEPMMGVQLVSTISSATFVGDSAILKSGINTLADEVIVGGQYAHGDAIVDLGGINILAHDNHGQITLATTQGATRRVVFDADLPRYYACGVASPSHETLHLLQNILVYLAQ